MALWIGLSLGTFGVCQTLVQALLPGPATKWLGERGAVIVGIAGACIALVVMAFANQGWIVFAIMPMFALGGLGAPALQTRATRLAPPPAKASSKACWRRLSAWRPSSPRWLSRHCTLSSRRRGREPSGSRWWSLCARGPTGNSRHPDRTALRKPASA